jgi:hypothetical protein
MWAVWGRDDFQDEGSLRRRGVDECMHIIVMGTDAPHISAALICGIARLFAAREHLQRASHEQRHDIHIRVIMQGQAGTRWQRKHRDMCLGSELHMPAS